MLLNWDESAFFGGAEVLSYILIVENQDTTNEYVVEDDTSFRLTELVNDEVYRFTIYAENSYA